MVGIFVGLLTVPAIVVSHWFLRRAGVRRAALVVALLAGIALGSSAFLPWLDVRWRDAPASRLTGPELVRQDSAATDRLYRTDSWFVGSFEWYDEDSQFAVAGPGVPLLAGAVVVVAAGWLTVRPRPGRAATVLLAAWSFVALVAAFAALWDITVAYTASIDVGLWLWLLAAVALAVFGPALNGHLGAAWPRPLGWKRLGIVVAVASVAVVLTQRSEQVELLWGLFFPGWNRAYGLSEPVLLLWWLIPAVAGATGSMLLFGAYQRGKAGPPAVPGPVPVDGAGPAGSDAPAGPDGSASPAGPEAGTGPDAVPGSPAEH